MVKLLLGNKGAGKTKKMVALANDKVEEKKGDLVFINKNDRISFDLKHDVRLISMDEFPHIENIDEYVGFLYGLMSGNSDIETIYLDGTLRHANINLEDVKALLDRLAILSKDMDVELVVSISGEKEDLSDVDFNEFEVLA